MEVISAIILGGEWKGWYSKGRKGKRGIWNEVGGEKKKRREMKGGEKVSIISNFSFSGALYVTHYLW